jgi:hypothetical protein
MSSSREAVQHAPRRARFTRAKCEAVAGVVAAGSSFGSAENRGQFLPSQRCASMTKRPRKKPAEILALGPSCVSATPQLKREGSLVATIRLDLGI